MQSERRRATRYNFGAIAEVIDIGHPNGVVSLTRDLSLVGVFVKTPILLTKGAKVGVKIRHSGADFTAIGKVTGNITSEGMGVEFTRMEPTDRAVLEEWLGLTAKVSDAS
jgi:hypothetical protein